MGNSPIQVVLNTNNFIEEVENKGGGPSTDFFADNDVAFIEHRELLTQQLREIKKLILHPFWELENLGSYM